MKRRISKNSKKYKFLLIIGLIFSVIPSLTLAFSITFGSVIFDVLKKAVQTVMVEAVNVGIDKAGESIFKGSWEYARDPTIKIVKSAKNALTPGLYLNSSGKMDEEYAKNAIELLEKDNYLSEVIAKEFSKLSSDQIQQIVITLLVTLDKKLDESLKNQLILLDNSASNLVNQQIIIEKLNTLTGSHKVVKEGMYHFSDKNRILEFYYPKKFSAPKHYYEDESYGYYFGSRSGLNNFWDFTKSFFNGYALELEVVAFKNSESSNIGKARENETLSFEEFVQEIRNSVSDNGFEIRSELIEEPPISKMYFVTELSVLTMKIYQVHMIQFGVNNYLKVAGQLDEDVWEEEGDRIRYGIYNVKWSSYLMNQYVNSKNH